uniref:Uncharacterized protein n=1 Tax=Anguilla anguilla TaxID=7936 RepID=A0A0E9RC72_ANGAN
MSLKHNGYKRSAPNRDVLFTGCTCESSLTLASPGSEAPCYSL